MEHYAQLFSFRQHILFSRLFRNPHFLYSLASIIHEPIRKGCYFMTRTTNTSFDYTPACVKQLVRAISIASLLAISFNTLFPAIQIFTLNSLCLSSLYFWQPFTSLFIIPSSELSFSFLLDFFFAMVILYSAGKTLVFAYGRTHFFGLYALGGILSAAAALASMHFYNNTSYIFSAAYPAILSVVVAWIMLIPYQKVFLYFVIPIQASWIAILAIVGTVFLNTARGDYIQALAYLTALITGYVYSLIALGLSGPFTSLAPLERFIVHAAKKAMIFWEWKIMKKLRK